MGAEDVMRALREGEGFVDIVVYVRPESRGDKLALEGGELVFYTEEPPVKGRANAALIRYLSRLLGVSSSAVRVVRGARSRSKVVRVTGMGLEDVAARIAAALGGDEHGG